MKLTEGAVMLLSLHFKLMCVGVIQKRLYGFFFIHRGHLCVH